MTNNTLIVKKTIEKLVNVMMQFLFIPSCDIVIIIRIIKSLKVRGTDWCVTKPFPAVGLGGGAVSPPAGPGPRRSPGGKRILEQMF